MTEANQAPPGPARQAVELDAGTLAGILDWNELDQLWQRVIEATGTGWYLYTPDKLKPGHTATKSELQSFIVFLKAYLRAAQDKDYCGIVYVDSITHPSLIKVFDPKALLSMCNINGAIPAPSWVITTLDPAHMAAWAEPPSQLHYYGLGKKIPLPAAPKHPQANDTLDARRMGCPLPLVNTSLALKRLAIDEILEVITFEPGAVNDIAYICQCTGHKHVALAKGSYGYSFFIQRMKTHK